jgi:hypothetical protein
VCFEGIVGGHWPEKWLCSLKNQPVRVGVLVVQNLPIGLVGGRMGLFPQELDDACVCALQFRLEVERERGRGLWGGADVKELETGRLGGRPNLIDWVPCQSKRDYGMGGCEFSKKLVVSC